MNSQQWTKTIELGLKMIMKLLCQRKDIHKGTLVIPGSNTTNQIDHVLFKEKHSDLITKVGTYGSTDSDSDHFLVEEKLKQ